MALRVRKWPRKMYVMTDIALGLRIRRARERKRWTQERLAAEVGVGPRSIGRWERGEAEPRWIGALEEALGVNLTGEAEPDPNEEALRSLDLDPRRMEKLVKAYHEIMQNGAAPQRERAG